MNTTSVDKYARFKRKIYLITLPIICMTNALYWYFSPYVDRFMYIVLPVFCIFLLIFWLFFYFNYFFRTVELIGLVLFSLYHIYRIYSMAIYLEEGVFSVYVFWSTIYFIYIFMVLERKRAFAFSLVILIITIILGIPYFDSIGTNNALLQYYASTLIYILVLFYFQKIVTTYLEADWLRRSAFYDALTGIANRRLIDTWLENEVKRCGKSLNSFAVIYFDIDHFKKVNDKFGHDIGDYVLKELTLLIQNSLEATDFFGRWGGEEFIIVLQNESLEEATELAEKLRMIVEEHAFRYVGHITVSFGVTSSEPTDTTKTIIRRVDQALYMAKNSGRNNVKVL